MINLSLKGIIAVTIVFAFRDCSSIVSKTRDNVRLDSSLQDASV